MLWPIKAKCILIRTTKSKSLICGQNAHLTRKQHIFVHFTRRRLSVSIITAQSRCLLSRLPHMAPGAKEAAKKRAFSKHREDLARKDRLYHHEAYIRGRRLQDLGILHP